MQAKIFCVDESFATGVVLLSSSCTAEILLKLEEFGLQFSVLYWGCEADEISSPYPDWSEVKMDHDWDMEFWSPCGFSKKEIRDFMKTLGFVPEIKEVFQAHITPHYTFLRDERKR